MLRSGLELVPGAQLALDHAQRHVDRPLVGALVRLTVVNRKLTESLSPRPLVLDRKSKQRLVKKRKSIKIKHLGL